MAVSGLVLLGFVTGHLVGNLQIFSPPDQMNGYAHFLQSLGPALWAMRLFLLLCVGIHIWAGISLTLENRRARGADRYEAKRFIRASFVIQRAFREHQSIFTKIEAKDSDGAEQSMIKHIRRTLSFVQGMESQFAES